MIAIDSATRVKLVEYLGTMSETAVATYADGTFNLPIQPDPNAVFVQITNAKCFTAIVHSMVKLSIFSGDVIFANHHEVKVFSGVLCSQEGATTIAIITTFEYIRNDNTATKLNPICLEYVPVQSLFETMSQLEECVGEQKRHSLSCHYVEQVDKHTKQVLDTLNDPAMITMFTTASLEHEAKDKNNPADKNKGGKGHKGGKGGKGGSNKKRLVYIFCTIMISSYLLTIAFYLIVQMI